MNRKIYSDKMLSSLRAHLEKERSKYITYPKFIFLCGKSFNSSNPYEETNRGIIHDYVKKICPDTFIVLSERLWEDNFDSNIDLLTFEEFLAEVSDAIILFVESPGSYCELGAFAYADSLFSDKLIIVMDEQYRDSQSFITTGPILKAKKDGSSVVYAQLQNGALLSSKELREEILLMISDFCAKTSPKNKRIINKNENQVNINSFIAEIIELLRIVQPITPSDLLQLYREVKDFRNFSFAKRDASKFHREIKYRYILKLLMNVNIIKAHDSYITLTDFSKAQNLMFRYYGKAESEERNRMLCRKYRYGDVI